MIETAIALFAAHVFADFVLQIRWIIKNKHLPDQFLTHVVIVAATAFLALGACSLTAYAAVAIITVSHAVIDRVKLRQSNKPWVHKHRRGKLILFLADQALHIAFILLVAWILQDSWNQSWWKTLPDAWEKSYLIFLCVSGGLVLATRAGAFAIELFMKGFEPYAPPGPAEGKNELPPAELTRSPRASAEPQPDEQGEEEASKVSERKPDEGLVEGGKWIGLLERALIFMLIMAQQFQAIGFLIAAKSILRFQYSKERSHSETVIIGTLASFAWAIAVSWGTLELTELIKVART